MLLLWPGFQVANFASSHSAQCPTKKKFFHAEIARKKKVANNPTTHVFCLWNFSNSIFTHAPYQHFVIWEKAHRKSHKIHNCNASSATEISCIPYVCHQFFPLVTTPFLLGQPKNQCSKYCTSTTRWLGKFSWFAALRKKVCLVIVIPPKWMPFKNPSGIYPVREKNTRIPTNFHHMSTMKTLHENSYLPGFAGAACQSCPELETPDSDGQRRWTDDDNFFYWLLLQLELYYTSKKLTCNMTMEKKNHLEMYLP